MANDELSSECLDRLEAAIADLVVTQASMAAKLDLLLLKMDTLLTSQHLPSSSFAKALPTHTPMPTPPPMPIPPPQPALMKHTPHPCWLRLPLLPSTSPITASPRRPPPVVVGLPSIGSMRSSPATTSFPSTSAYSLPSRSLPRSGTRSSTTLSSSPSTPLSTPPKGFASATLTFICARAIFLHPF
ncbi:hypothetical protein AAZX31_13G023200 [Glycine max]